MAIRMKRIMIPVCFCLAVACLIEIPLGQTDLFGDDVILWDTLFRAIVAMPGLLYFYREDRVFRGVPRLDARSAAALAAAGAVLSLGFGFVFARLGVAGYTSSRETLLTGNLPLQAVVLLAASPLLEECFFRGVLYGRMKELLPTWAALVGSALFFGLYHGNPAQGIYGFVMGLFLAWAMERYRTVKAPIVIHVAANLVGMLL